MKWPEEVERARGKCMEGLSRLWLNHSSSYPMWLEELVDEYVSAAYSAGLEEAAKKVEEVGKRWDAGTSPRAACFAASNEIRALKEKL